jgi:hypothetical protein
LGDQSGDGLRGLLRNPRPRDRPKPSEGLTACGTSNESAEWLRATARKRPKDNPRPPAGEYRTSCRGGEGVRGRLGAVAGVQSYRPRDPQAGDRAIFLSGEASQRPLWGLVQKVWGDRLGDRPIGRPRLETRARPGDRWVRDRRTDFSDIPQSRQSGERWAHSGTWRRCF